MIMYIPNQQGGKLLQSSMLQNLVHCFWIGDRCYPNLTCCFLTSLNNSLTFVLFFSLRRRHILSVRSLKLRHLLRWRCELSSHHLHNMLCILNKSRIPSNRLTCYLFSPVGPLSDAREKSNSSQRWQSLPKSDDNMIIWWELLLFDESGSWVSMF